MALNLTEAQAARVRQVYMLSGIRQGISGNATIDLLRSLGLGQRTSVMQAQIASLIGRPGPLPSLEPDVLQQLYDATPMTYLTSRSSQNYVYSFEVPEGMSVTGSSQADIASIVSEIPLPDHAAKDLAFEKLQFSRGSSGKIQPGDIKLLKPRKFRPFNPATSSN